MDTRKLALIFKALSDENRLEIINILLEGELCACHLLDHLQISQSTLSHHLKLLNHANLIEVRKEGKWSYYQINVVQYNLIIDYLNKFTKKEQTHGKKECRD